VVVEGFDAVVTDSTMITSWRTPDRASLAIFDRHVHGGNVRSCELHHNPVVRGWTYGKRIFGRIGRRHLVEITGNDLGAISANKDSTTEESSLPLDQPPMHVQMRRNIGKRDRQTQPEWLEKCFATAKGPYNAG
jgi:hypothetical protein